MNNIKLIIFDLDGTLVDAYSAIEKSVNYTLKSTGYPLMDYMTIRRAVGKGDEELLEQFVNVKDLKKALVLYRRHHKIALLKYSTLMPNARRVLRYLKSKNYKLAVASNRPTKFAQILTHHLNITQYFNYSLCADKLKFGKPHPEILLKIIQRLHVKRVQSLYVGDMTIDAQTGKRARVKTIIVATGSSTISEIKKANPQCIIRNLSALLNML
jgi:HAD superfamily hydrolase (TIGR01509 family)